MTVFESTGTTQSPREWIAERWPSFVVAPVDLDVQAWADADTGIDEGLYFLEDAAGGLLYVGLSNSIARRLSQHAKRGVIPFTHVRVLEIDLPHMVWRRYIESIEAAYINVLKPPFNEKYTFGRLADQSKMEAAIAGLWKPV